MIYIMPKYIDKKNPPILTYRVLLTFGRNYSSHSKNKTNKKSEGITVHIPKTNQKYTNENK
jgi:hypothetical protein